MAVRARFDRLHCLLTGAWRICAMLCIGVIMKTLLLLNKNLADRFLQVMFTPSNLSSMKRRFNIKAFWSRPFQMMPVVWRMWLDELSREARVGQMAPDPPLIDPRSGQLHQPVTLSDVCRRLGTARPVVLIFGSCT